MFYLWTYCTGSVTSPPLILQKKSTKDCVGDKLKKAMGTCLSLSEKPRGNTNNKLGGLLSQSLSPASQRAWMNWGIYLKDFPNCFQTLINSSFRQVISPVDFFHEEATFILIYDHKGDVSCEKINTSYLKGYDYVSILRLHTVSTPPPKTLTREPEFGHSSYSGHQ